MLEKTFRKENEVERKKKKKKLDGNKVVNDFVEKKIFFVYG